jgi:hypothetical protein
MAMSDCEKCWDTPCVCGWKYKDYTHDYLLKFIVSTVQYRPAEEAKLLLQEALEKIENKPEENGK